MKIIAYVLLFTLLLIALPNLHSTRPVHAQSSIELENVQAAVHFGERIVFIARITPSIAIQDVSILISEESQGITHVEAVTIQEDGQTEFHFDVMENALRPFTTVQWRYQFTFQDGSTAQSEIFSVRYVDNRFDWQTLEADGLQVSWYEVDASFGQAALDAARAGLKSIGELLLLDLTEPVEIYIYTKLDDLRLTLARGSEEWVAGHADPALGVVMVAIEPGEEHAILMEQRIPHEVMHIMLYRRLGAGYHHVPVWLREGMATLVELYSNLDYEHVLGDAVTSNSLIPLSELCSSFPTERGRAFLAYAQSRSFTQYLLNSYGSTELLNLAITYADGVDCERGPERVFGAPLSKLETEWLSSISEQNSLLPALQSLAPYLVLLCLVLIIPLIGIASTFPKKGNHHGRETFVRK